MESTSSCWWRTRPVAFWPICGPIGHRWVRHGAWATLTQGGDADGEHLLDFLYMRWADATLSKTVHLNALYTWTLVYKLLGHRMADLWPPLRVV